MNNSIYEEYMRSVLGYQPMENYNTYDMNTIQTEELESCYPDIYRIVYPMIKKACMQNTRTITRELIDDMTEEIYFSIEDKESEENRNKEDRQIVRRNTGLNDLIRILLIRELLGRPGFPGGRPPRPMPPRPMPPRPPMRPPMRPRIY